MRSYDKEFISVAEELVKKSTMHHKLAAVITNKKRIVSVGINRFLGLNSYIGMSDKWSIHAECDALRKALAYIHDNPNVSLTMYVARKNKKLAKPCPNCLKLITPYIDRIVYTDGGKIVEEFTTVEE